MKYVFCIIAIFLQPFFTWNVYKKQDKRQAALKMPMLYMSVAYVVCQIYIFVKYCRKFPASIELYSYLIQGGILLVFILIELAFFGSNQHIERVEKQEQESICEYKSILDELKICKAMLNNSENLNSLENLFEKIRYEDPVSSPEVTAENKKIYELIQELPMIQEHESFQKKCDQIQKQVEIRKIKNKKVRG